MILLQQNATSEEMIVTLNEKRTLSSGYYLFRFVHILTKQVVSKVYSFADDDSEYQDRYNSFEVNPAVLFLNQPVGMWTYAVYEQASSTNTDPTGLNEVEVGIMQLQVSTPFAFESYNEPTTYKAYEG